MASVVVFCERTPFGLHPSSRMALCVARDLGSRRGATVVAVCEGDGGDFDAIIEQECGQVGADQLVFSGPEGLRRTAERLTARHIMVGWTPAGETAARDYLAAERQDARGKHKYDPALYGLDHEQVQRKYAHYTERFGLEIAESP